MNETAKEISRLVDLAIEAENAKDMDCARALYARCLELDEGSDSAAHSPGDGSVSRRAWLGYAMFLSEQGEVEGALALAERAAVRWPQSSWPVLMAGRCHAELGQLEQAETAFRKSLSIKQRPETLSFLADVLRRQGREAESLACLHAVLELDPNYEEAHYNIGCNLRVNGDYAAAIECFRKAIAIDPAYAVAHAELGFALVLDARQGDDEVDVHRIALEHLKRSVALDSEYHWSRIYLANELWQFGRTREARVHYEAAVSLRPNDGFVLALYADFLSAALGQSLQAELLFERAIEVDPEDDHVRYWYGKHLLRARRHAEARRELLLADRLGHPAALAVLASFEIDGDK